jgi:hypothetical protein
MLELEGEASVTDARKVCMFSDKWWSTSVLILIRTATSSFAFSFSGETETDQSSARG